MSARDEWRQEYLTRVHALHHGGGGGGPDARLLRTRRWQPPLAISAGKDDDDDDAPAAAAAAAAPPDLNELFERLPGNLVAKIIMMDTDLLAYERMIRAAATTKPVGERSASYIHYRAAFERAFADDVFWQRWVTGCFVQITRLPAKSRTWRGLAKRILELVCTTRICLALRDARLTDELCLEPVAMWKSFRNALDRETTCSALFRAHYSTGQSADIIPEFFKQPRLNLWSNELVIITTIGSEGFRATGQFTGLGIDRGHTRPTPLHQWITPVDFVSDRLFDMIDARVMRPSAEREQTNRLLRQLFFV